MLCIHLFSEGDYTEKIGRFKWDITEKDCEICKAVATKREKRIKNEYLFDLSVFCICAKEAINKTDY